MSLVQLGDEPEYRVAEYRGVPPHQDTVMELPLENDNDGVQSCRFTVTAAGFDVMVSRGLPESSAFNSK